MLKKNIDTLLKENIYFLGIVIVVAAVFLYHRMSLPPDQFFVLVLILSLLVGKAGQFLKDWIPFIFLVLLYDYLRGAVPHLSVLPHISPMINFGQNTKGFNFAVELQKYYFTLGNFQWYDYGAVFLYMIHFIVPLTLALYFWVNDKKLFKQYTWALVILSYLALVTFIVFPAAPPWWASVAGYLPRVDKIYDAITATLPQAFPIPTIYQIIPPNFVAAVPSLHGAYPVLTFLFLYKKFGESAFWSLIYVGLVWLSSLYLGDHYSPDLIIGAAYAGFTYWLVTRKALV